MEEHFIRFYHIKREKFEGIYVFLANEKYVEGDLLKKKNCSKPLCWMIFPDRMEKILEKHPDINLICDLELIRFKREARPTVAYLLETVSTKVVQLMIDRVEIFIRETIKKKYD